MPGRRRKDTVPDTSAADAEADALSCELNVLAGLRTELSSSWGMTSAESMADTSDPLPVLDGHGLLDLDAMLEEPFGTWELKPNAQMDELASSARLLDSRSLFATEGDEDDFTSGQAKRTASYRQLADLLEAPSALSSPEHHSTSWALSDGSSGRGSPSSVDFSLNTVFNASELGDNWFGTDDFNPLICDTQSLKPLADIEAGSFDLTLGSSLNFPSAASPDRKRRRMGGPQLFDFAESDFGSVSSQRRAELSEIERVRRREMRTSLVSLRKELPDLADQPRIPMRSVLRTAIDCIRGLTRESNRLESNLSQMRARNARLLDSISTLQQC